DVATAMEGGRGVAMEVMKGGGVEEVGGLADQFQSNGKSSFIVLTSNHLPYIFSETSSQHLVRTARFQDSTLCLIKPHAVNAGQAGKIIDAIIKEGYHISDMELVHLDKANAEEFLEVYKGVVPEYH
ncbi:Nucleoside diphosphate kinase 7, partial [Borealophlyctis nickersoniae]